MSMGVTELFFSVAAREGMPGNMGGDGTFKGRIARACGLAILNWMYASSSCRYVMRLFGIVRSERWFRIKVVIHTQATFRCVHGFLVRCRRMQWWEWKHFYGSTRKLSGHTSIFCSFQANKKQEIMIFHRSKHWRNLAVMALNKHAHWPSENNISVEKMKTFFNIKDETFGKKIHLKFGSDSSKIVHTTCTQPKLEFYPILYRVGLWLEYIFKL